jgi:hypothetical protein
MTWRGTLSLACFGGCVFYVFFEKYGSPVSQAVLAELVLLILVSMWIYMRRVEGRGTLRLATQAMLIWAMTWLVERAALGRELAGWTYAYNGSHPLSWGPAGVPVLIPTVWLAFCWVEDAVISALRGVPEIGRKSPPFRNRVLECLAGGWILLSIDVAFEWHFAKAAEFWKWEGVPGAGAAIAGVPIWNFLLWFAVGALVPFTGGLFLRGIKKKTMEANSVGIRFVPILGLGILLAAGSVMNLSYGVREGAIFCGFSLLAILAVLGRALRQRPFGNARDRAEATGQNPISPRAPRSTPL